MVCLEIQPVRCNRDSQPLTPASGLSYTLAVRFLPQPQRASPPRQLELTPPGAAEFVICDHTIEPGKRGGKPCIRGMRITVYDVLQYLASGMSEQEIIDDFPELMQEDIRACLSFAADRERKLVAAIDP